VPVIGRLFEFFHRRVLGGRHMKYGFETSFTEHGLRRIFKQAGFTEMQTGFFDDFTTFHFIPGRTLKAVCRRLSKQRLFWTNIYLDARK
jgi:hypothetical protein